MTTSVDMLAVTAANVQKAYIAYFGRPADPAGLNFWTTAGTSGTTMLTIMRDFGNSAEFTALYGSGTNPAFVNAIYVNVFGRSADAAGLNFYVNALTDGSITRADVVFNVLNGATGADATIVENKVSFSTQYTDALATNVSAYVNYDSAFGIPQARTALSGITESSTAAQITASVTTNITTVAAGATPPVTTGNAYTFSTNVETFSGTAFADTFDGRVAATNGTFQDGDVAFGGAGNDTLTLVAQGGSATAALNSIETVNVRLIANTDLDVLSWSGTTNIAITNDSVDAKTLTIRNAASGVMFTVSDNDNLTVSHLDDSGTNTARFTLNNASGTTLTTDNTELINVGVSGAVNATIEASAATTITVTGAGSLTLATNDTISALNLAGFVGSATTNISSSTNVQFTGADGNDDVTFFHLTSADTVSGGSGTDTLRASLDGDSNALRNVTNVEIGVFSVSANVATTASGFQALTLTGGTAATTLNLSGLNATEVNLNVGTADSVTIGYTAGAANIDLGFSGGVSFSTIRVSGAATNTFDVEVGSAAYTVDSLRFGDLGDTVNATNVSVGVGRSGSLTVTELRARQASDLTLSIGANSSYMTVTDLQASGVTTLTLTAGDATTTNSLNVVDTITLSGQAASFIVNAGQNSNVKVEGISADRGANLFLDLNVASGARFGSAAQVDIAIATSGTLSIDADGGASAAIDLGAINIGAGNLSGLSLDLGVAGSGEVGAITAFDIGAVAVTVASEGSATLSTIAANAASGNLASITLTQTSSGTISVGSAVAQTMGAVTLTAGASGRVSIGDLTASSIGAVSVNVGASSTATVGSAAVTVYTSLQASGGAEADITVGAIVASTRSVGALSLDVGSSGSITVGAINAASSTIGLISGTVGAEGSLTIGALNASGGIGGLVLNLAVSADATVGTITTDAPASSQNVFGGVFVSGGDETDVSIGLVSADAGFSGMSVTLGASASFTIGGINAHSASIGNLSFSLGHATIASANSLDAQSTIGNITLTGSGTLDINSLNASASIGTISIDDGSIVNIASIETKSLGSITVSGDNAIITSSADVMGNITLRGSAAQITLASAAVGDVLIAGSGQITIDFGRATGVGQISTVGNVGSATLTLTNVSGQADVTLGAGTNNVTVGRSGAVLTLQAGTGTDAIIFASTASDEVAVRNFQFGSGSDSLQFASSGGFVFGFGSAAIDGAQQGQNLNVVVITGKSAGVTLDGSAATDVLVVATGTYSGITDVLAALDDNSLLGVSAVGGSSVTAGGQMLILWYNSYESRTELTLVNATAVATPGDNMFSAISSYDSIATFSGNITTAHSATESFIGDFKLAP